MHFLSSLLTHTVQAAFGAALGISAFFQPHPRPVTVIQPAPTPQAASSTIPAKPTVQKKKSVAVVATPAKKPNAPAPLLPPSAPPTQPPQPIVPAPVVPTQPSAAPLPTISTEATNSKLRASLVNILCTTQAGGSFRPISGSGVIIDTRGIILTNAHVGQFFLLKDYPFSNSMTCVIRMGSPAATKYYAKLLYIPDAWVRDNANQLKSTEATGTGENDYAFLVITATTDGSPLPAQFPAVDISLDQPAKADTVILAAYPAQFLGGATIQMNLYASSAVTPIQNVYTFDTGTIDVLSIGNTVVSQSGSSGGSVARATDGAVVGLIATATEGTTTATRELRAITLAHIDRSLQSFGKGGLVSFLLSGDLSQKVADFNTIVAPNLAKLLTDVLSR